MLGLKSIDLCHNKQFTCRQLHLLLFWWIWRRISSPPAPSNNSIPFPQRLLEKVSFFLFCLGNRMRVFLGTGHQYQILVSSPPEGFETLMQIILSYCDILDFTQWTYKLHIFLLAPYLTKVGLVYTASPTLSKCNGIPREYMPHSAQQFLAPASPFH